MSFFSNVTGYIVGKSPPLSSKSWSKSHVQSICQITFYCPRRRFSSTMPDLPFLRKWLCWGSLPNIWYTFASTHMVITSSAVSRGSDPILTSRFSRSSERKLTTTKRIKAEEYEEDLPTPPLLLPLPWYIMICTQTYWWDNVSSSSAIPSGSNIP